MSFKCFTGALKNKIPKRLRHRGPNVNNVNSTNVCFFSACLQTANIKSLGLNEKNLRQNKGAGGFPLQQPDKASWRKSQWRTTRVNQHDADRKPLFEKPIVCLWPHNRRAGCVWTSICIEIHYSETYFTGLLWRLSSQSQSENFLFIHLGGKQRRPEGGTDLLTGCSILTCR